MTKIVQLIAQDVPVRLPQFKTCSFPFGTLWAVYPVSL